MADNLTTQEGVGGPQVATNEIAGVHHARSKTGWGAPGVYNDVDAAHPLPVQAAALPLPTGAATRAARDAYIEQDDDDAIAALLILARA